MAIRMYLAEVNPAFRQNDGPDDLFLTILLCFILPFDDPHSSPFLLGTGMCPCVSRYVQSTKEVF